MQLFSYNLSRAVADTVIPEMMDPALLGEELASLTREYGFGIKSFDPAQRKLTTLEGKEYRLSISTRGFLVQVSFLR